MRGTIIAREGKKKQPNGKPVITYQVIVDTGIDANGKRTQKWKTFRTKKQAENYLNETVNQVERGVYIKPSKMTFTDFSNKWLSEYAKVNLSPVTFESYDLILKKHLQPELGKIGIAQVKPDQIQGYYANKLEDGLSAMTIHHHHAILHEVYKFAMKWGVAAHNPADATDPPKPQKREMNVWNQNEVQAFLEHAKETEYYILFYTSLFTGMRRSELLALRWSDVDLLGMQVSVNRSIHLLKGNEIVYREPKTAKSRRAISLTPSNALLLQEHLDKRKQALKSKNPKFEDKDFNQNELVFRHADGSPYLPNSVTHAWIKLVRRCGLKNIRLHDARHTMATMMLKMGVHPKIVQERLGHSSITVTMDTYSHVLPGLQKAAAAKLDEVFSNNETRLEKDLKEVMR